MQAQKLAEDIANAMAAETAAAKQREIARVVAQSETGQLRRAVRSTADRLIRASNLGLLSEQRLYEIIRGKMKLPSLSDAELAEVRRRAEALQTKPAGAERQELVAKLMAFVEQRAGFSAADLGWSAFYASILSGPKTHAVNVVDTVINVLSEFQANAIADPRSAVEMLRGLGIGLRRGLTDAKGVLATGIVTGTRLHKHEGLRAVELKAMQSGPWHWTQAAKYVSRAMAAEDMVNFRAAEEMRARQSATQQARAEGLRTRREVRARVDEILARTQPQLAAAKIQATAEGLTGWRARRRAWEIVEQQRGQPLVQDAADFARRTTYNQDPEGRVGAIAEGIGGIVRNVPGLRAVVPFVRIVANVFNRTLDYSPLGYKRAFAGMGGGVYATEAPTGRAQRVALIKATEGTLVLAAWLAMALRGGGDDGEEPLLETTADGPSDFALRNQLMQQGWRPFSIKIGGRWWSYRYTPLHLVGSIVGAWADAEKYGRWQDRELQERTSLSLGVISRTILGQTYLSGLQDFLSDISTPGGNGLQKFTRKLGSAVTPRLIQDVDAIWSPERSAANNPLQALTQSVPVLRQYANPPAFDALGLPVKTSPNPLSRFVGPAAEASDPVWQVIQQRSLRIPVVRGAVNLPPNATWSVKRRADREQRYAISTESSRQLYDKLRQNLDWLRNADPDAAQDYIDNWAAYYRASARQAAAN